MLLQRICQSHYRGGRDADLLPKLDSIDEAVSGYILDLAPTCLSSSVSLGQPAHPLALLPVETMTLSNNTRLAAVPLRAETASDHRSIYAPQNPSPHKHFWNQPV